MKELLIRLSAVLVNLILYPAYSLVNLVILPVFMLGSSLYFAFEDIILGKDKRYAPTDGEYYALNMLARGFASLAYVATATLTTLVLQSLSLLSSPLNAVMQGSGYGFDGFSDLFKNDVKNNLNGGIAAADRVAKSVVYAERYLSGADQTPAKDIPPGAGAGSSSDDAHNSQAGEDASEVLYERCDSFDSSESNASSLDDMLSGYRTIFDESHRQLSPNQLAELEVENAWRKTLRDVGLQCAITLDAPSKDKATLVIKQYRSGYDSPWHCSPQAGHFHIFDHDSINYMFNTDSYTLPHPIHREDMKHPANITIDSETYRYYNGDVQYARIPFDKHNPKLCAYYDCALLNFHGQEKQGLEGNSEAKEMLLNNLKDLGKQLEAKVTRNNAPAVSRAARALTSIIEGELENTDVAGANTRIRNIRQAHPIIDVQRPSRPNNHEQPSCNQQPNLDNDAASSCFVS